MLDDFVTLTDVNKTYRMGSSSLVAVSDVNLILKQTEIVSLIGPSGCGKTTLINLIAGFDQPTSGSVIFNHNVHGRRIQRVVVFQADSVFPWMTVEENIGYSLKLAHVDANERS